MSIFPHDVKNISIVFEKKIITLIYPFLLSKLSKSPSVIAGTLIMIRGSLLVNFP